MHRVKHYKSCDKEMDARGTAQLGTGSFPSPALAASPLLHWQLPHSCTGSFPSPALAASFPLRWLTLGVGCVQAAAALQLPNRELAAVEKALRGLAREGRVGGLCEDGRQVGLDDIGGQDRPQEWGPLGHLACKGAKHPHQAGDRGQLLGSFHRGGLAGGMYG